MHGQRLHVDAGRDGKQNVTHMQRLPDGELRSVRLVVALALVLVRFGAVDLGFNHGLQHLAIGFTRLGGQVAVMRRQQTLRHGALAQQFGISAFAQLVLQRALACGVQGHAVDAGGGQCLRSGQQGSTGSAQAGSGGIGTGTGAAAATAAAAAAGCRGH